MAVKPDFNLVLPSSISYWASNIHDMFLDCAIYRSDNLFIADSQNLFHEHKAIAATTAVAEEWNVKALP